MCVLDALELFVRFRGRRDIGGVSVPKYSHAQPTSLSLLLFPRGGGSRIRRLRAWLAMRRTSVLKFAMSD